MPVHHAGYRIRGFYRVAKLWPLWQMTLKDAQRRLYILRFWDRHGLKAPPARDAFGVSRAKDPLAVEKKALSEQGGNPAARAGCLVLRAPPQTPATSKTATHDSWRKSAGCKASTPQPRQREAACPACPPWCEEKGIARCLRS
jgi:hypothetical protein